MYTSTITAEITSEIVTQHIQDLHREAGTRRLAKLVPTTANNRTRRAGNDFGSPTMPRWHVASAH
jgi:hypothetical protein